MKVRILQLDLPLCPFRFNTGGSNKGPVRDGGSHSSPISAKNRKCVYRDPGGAVGIGYRLDQFVRQGVRRRVRQLSIGRRSCNSATIDSLVWFQAKEHVSDAIGEMDPAV